MTSEVRTAAVLRDDVNVTNTFNKRLKTNTRPTTNTKLPAHTENNAADR